MSRPMNALYRNAGFLCVAAMVLAACSESTTTPTPRGVTAGAASTNQYPEFNGPSADAHIMHTRPWFAQNPSDGTPGGAHGKPGGGGGSTNNGISFHGGSVLQQATNVVAVYWAGTRIFVGGPDVGTWNTSSNSADGSLVGNFLRNFGNSPYFAINTTYYDANHANIQSVVNYTGYWANGTNAPSGSTRISDAQMVAMLQSGFDSGNLKYDSSTLYAIFTSGQVNLGGGFGTQYCAYHTHGTVTIDGASKTVLYAALPYDYAFPSACTAGTRAANGTVDPGADYEVNTLAHETEETTTDMLGTAWFDSRGFENADKCAWTFGSTYTTAAGGTANMTVGGVDYLVQRNWVNASGGFCALSL